MSRPFDLPLNHDDLRRWRVCARRFWLSRRKPLAQATPAEVPASVVDAALRASYPLGDAIPPPRTPLQWPRAMGQTLHCLSGNDTVPEGWAVLGACLTSEDRAQARIDVVTQTPLGFQLFRVRCATVGDDADIDTVAWWTHVMARCGFRVQSVGLLLVDTDFTYPGHGCYAGLFREVDLGPVLGSRPVAQWLTGMRTCERGPEPAATPGPHCTQQGGCEFSTQCAACARHPAQAEAERQASLDILGREQAAELRAAGHANVHSVPLRSLANPRHRRAVQAVQQGGPVCEPEAATALRALPYPRHCLRIDTIGLAVPLWPGTQPYQVLPFQWSCRVQHADGHTVQHGFLADAQGPDPRRAFAQSLLQALGDSGPVLAYNAGFERNRIRDLAQQFDDLAPALHAVLARLVDLYPLARDHCYHPVMAGSWSFKSISKAVAPDLQDRLTAIERDGDPSAQAVFARLQQRGLDATGRQQLRTALQAHGQTQAEVVHRLACVLAHTTPWPPA